MLFNSFQFALFLPLVFLIYWFVVNKNLRLQNLFIVAASYLFYGWWDWRFLILIAITTAASFYSGLLIGNNRDKSPKTAKWTAISNIVFNLLILGTFKYFNFFGENLAKLIKLFGYEIGWVELEILLPVGISFYTFQALSYTIDVYKRKIEPTNDVVSFFAYVSFFPQLVAGPIERATNLLPQFYKKRNFDYANAVSGMRQILWGLFKKIVVADNCAQLANYAFENQATANSSVLVVGAIMFTFQIYCDFSGYSDIAIGTARLFGINLMQNFNFPYFARNIAEFWRRWHISLTTWFRDYIYIPLGGSRGSKWHSLRNTLVIFIVSGFWHGANWTFVAWGTFHALLFAPLLLTGNNRRFTSDVVAQNKQLPNLKELLQMSLTFALVVVGWIIFRANTISDAVHYLERIFDKSFFTIPVFQSGRLIATFAIIILVIVEWIGRRNKFALEDLPSNRFVRNAIYLLLIIIMIGMAGKQEAFIYFQF